MHISFVEAQLLKWVEKDRWSDINIGQKPIDRPRKTQSKLDRP